MKHIVMYIMSIMYIFYCIIGLFSFGILVIFWKQIKNYKSWSKYFISGVVFTNRIKLL